MGPQKGDENRIAALQGDQAVAATQILFPAIPDPFFPIFGKTADSIHMVLSRSRSQAFNDAGRLLGQILPRLAGFFEGCNATFDFRADKQ